MVALRIWMDIKKTTVCLWWLYSFKGVIHPKASEGPLLLPTQALGNCPSELSQGSQMWRATTCAHFTHSQGL